VKTDPRPISRKEWNHNGHPGKNESYDVDFNIEPVWHLPFRIGGAGLAFDGCADYNTPRGKDAAGRDVRQGREPGPGADQFTLVVSLAVHLPLGGSGH